MEVRKVLQQLARRGRRDSTTDELDNVQWERADGHNDGNLPGKTGRQDERQIWAAVSTVSYRRGSWTHRSTPGGMSC